MVNVRVRRRSASEDKPRTGLTEVAKLLMRATLCLSSNTLEMMQDIKKETVKQIKSRKHGGKFY